MSFDPNQNRDKDGKWTGNGAAPDGGKLDWQTAAVGASVVAAGALGVAAASGMLGAAVQKAERDIAANIGIRVAGAAVGGRLASIALGAATGSRLGLWGAAAGAVAGALVAPQTVEGAGGALSAAAEGIVTGLRPSPGLNLGFKPLIDYLSTGKLP